MTTPQVADYIRSLVPYVPGKPIEETQREFNLKRVIKLASNENPLGPSPKAVSAMKRVASDLHRYPDGSAFHLKQALSKAQGLPPNQLIIGNGSEEVLDFVIRAFCVPGDSIVTSQAAFIAYKISAQIHGMSTLEAPLLPDYRFDLPALARLARESSRVKVIFVANPNNPTGTYVGDKEMRAFLRDVQTIRGGSVLVLLDSAYWEYVTAKDLPDPVELMREFPNVVVTKTFSKIYGLAGLRVGYGMAAPELISLMEKVRKPFNINSMALAAAQAALSDTSFVKRSRNLNDQGKKFWQKQLDQMGIPYWETQGNFLLADVTRGMGKTGGEVYQECLRLGVIFRPVMNYGMTHALRISFGTMEENRIAARALEAVASPRAAGVMSKSAPTKKKAPVKKTTAKKTRSKRR